MLVRFLKRSTIKLADGQIIFGQEGQECELQGDALEAALAAGDVEELPVDAELDAANNADAEGAAKEAADKAAAEAAAKEAADKVAAEAAAKEAADKVAAEAAAKEAATKPGAKA